MASERSKKQRLEDNKGVRDGTIRRGKGGKSIRKYDAKSGRWKKMSLKGAAAAKKYGSVSQRGKKLPQTTYNPGGKTKRANTGTNRSADRSVTSATVSSALKTEKPRSVASVKGYIDNYMSARRKLRADIQNTTRPIKMSAKDIKTKAQARAVLVSKNASSSLKAAARRVIEGR
jgi:hypothetical protein